MPLRPFDADGVVRQPDGSLGYTDLQPSLTAAFARAVELVPERECWVELGGERLTYAEAWERSRRVAGGLAASGVRTGDRVANRFSNSIDWCLAFWGALLAGGVSVPINARLAETEVRYIVEDSGAKVVLEPGRPLPDSAPHHETGTTGEDLAAIFYTSGTTGAPKGAMMSHTNFLSNCETCRRVIGVPWDPPMRNLVAVPLFHVTGCNSQMVVTTEMAGTTVIMPQFEVGEFLRAIEAERIDTMVAVPAVYWLAINDPAFSEFDTSSVRRIVYGGAPTPPEVIRRLRSAFPGARLGNGYGLTETSSVATFLPDEYAETRPDSVGFAAPPVELQIREADPDTGVGELLIRGQNVVRGYWNKPERSAETFVDGWLHTGDLARTDDEGFVVIVDRLKDMVNRGGENVYCIEVESALIRHPAVLEVAVVGVPDEVMGEKVGAVVVLRPGTDADGPTLRAFARELIADFKCPQFFAFRTEPLPRNPAGKVLKPVLRTDTDWLPELRDPRPAGTGDVR